MSDIFSDSTFAKKIYADDSPQRNIMSSSQGKERILVIL